MPEWREIFEEERQERRNLARSVCAVCLGDPTQGASVIGSGFLINSNTVATAYHILRDIDLSSTLFCVFGYYKSEADQVGFPDLSIYLGTLSQNGSWDSCPTDWVCLSLDDFPSGRPHLPVNSSGELDESAQMFAIGHPGGEPGKISDDCDVVEPEGDCFVINLTSEDSASGAPVFNSGLTVEGIIRESVGSDLENSRCLKAYRISC